MYIFRFSYLRFRYDLCYIHFYLYYGEHPSGARLSEKSFLWQVYSGARTVSNALLDASLSFYGYKLLMVTGLLVVAL